MRRRGARVDTRAPRQHDRFMLRRADMLRRALCAAEEQLERECIIANIGSKLARAIFAGDSFTHAGGVSLCNVVFGKRPSTLPPFETGEDAQGDCVAR
eukprot:4439754-Pyramimonas_sp.AAC.1